MSSAESGDRPGRAVRTPEDDRRRGGRRQERQPRRDDQPARRVAACACPAASRPRPMRFAEFLAHNDLAERINARLAELDIDDVRALASAGAEIRHWVHDAPLPGRAGGRGARRPIAASDGRATPRRRSPCARRPPPKTCPTRRSPASRRPSSTWYGIDDVLHKMKEVFASLYNDRAIAYRVHKGFAHADVALSAGVQRMVRSDSAPPA